MTTYVAHPPPPSTPPGAGPAEVPPRAPIGRSVRGVALVVLATAVLAELSIRSVAGGVAAVATVAVLAVGLATTGWVVRTGGRLLLVAAVALSTFLALRSSVWVIALDLVAIGALIALACSAEQGARAFDTRLGVVGRRWGAALVDVAGAAPDAVRLAVAVGPQRGGSFRSRLGAIGRGLSIAVPLVLVIGVLLAAADPVFASVFTFGLDLSGLPADVLVLVLAAWIATGCFVQATRPPVLRRERRQPIGPVEGIVVTGALTAVYAVFAWTQLVVAARGPSYVLETTGLTYAEYARSGFFQLLWVAGLTAVALVAVRSLVRTGDRGTRWTLAVLSTVAAGLTLVVVRAAIVRLDLYETAFGLTTLRYWSSAAAVWLGGLFVLLGVASALTARSTRRPAREWLPMAIGCWTLVAVVALNVADPDRTVAQHDVDRAKDGHELDVGYLTTLSDDAVPTLVAAVAELPGDAPELTWRLCERDRSGRTTWNRADRAAEAALAELCD